jgi:hypothetical protein
MCSERWDRGAPSPNVAKPSSGTRVDRSPSPVRTTKDSTSIKSDDILAIAAVELGDDFIQELDI